MIYFIDKPLKFSINKTIALHKNVLFWQSKKKRGGKKKKNTLISPLLKTYILEKLLLNKYFNSIKHSSKEK